MRMCKKSQQESLKTQSLVVLMVSLRLQHKGSSALKRFKTWLRRLHRLKGRCVRCRWSRRLNRGKLEVESCGLGYSIRID